MSNTEGFPTMRIDPERRAEINRQNSQKSTGPRTPQGKDASRRNALKHGLAALTLDPVDVPGEPPGGFRKQLDLWVDDLKPQNVLELTMVRRACRASWKLDRCARFEDALAARRADPPPRLLPPLLVMPPGPVPPREEPSPKVRAQRLGALLMLELEFLDDAYEEDEGRGIECEPYDNAPRDADLLCRFKEGVEWLIAEWEQVLKELPVEGEPPRGAVAVERRARAKAIRLLGLPTHEAPAKRPPHSACGQSLREAGEAELRRLGLLHAELSARPESRVESDLKLLKVGPEAELLLRYEAAAERELHRAVGTFLRLRQHPELVSPEEPAAAEEAPAAPDGSAAKVGSKQPSPRTQPAARNEATLPERLDPDSGPQIGRAGSLAPEIRRL